MRTDYKVIEKIHLRLDYKDKPSREMADVFHAAVRLCCRAYPIDPMRRPDATVATCQLCHGIVWERPQGYFSPKVLKTLAKQLGIRVKVVSFLENCHGKSALEVPKF